MNSIRGKTVKRSVSPTTTDTSGQVQPQTFLQSSNEQNNSFLQFLSTNAESAYRRPWHRLERGIRLNRIRKFVEEEKERYSLSDFEQQRLFNILLKALDKKLLNSKMTVVYDIEQEKILEIKGLVMHKLADGSLNFQLTDRKVGSTLKRKPGVSVNSTTASGEPE